MHIQQEAAAVAEGLNSITENLTMEGATITSLEVTVISILVEDITDDAIMDETVQYNVTVMYNDEMVKANK